MGWFAGRKKDVVEGGDKILIYFYGINDNLKEAK